MLTSLPDILIFKWNSLSLKTMEIWEKGKHHTSITVCTTTVSKGIRQTYVYNIHVHVQYMYTAVLYTCMHHQDQYYVHVHVTYLKHLFYFLLMYQQVGDVSDGSDEDLSDEVDGVSDLFVGQIMMSESQEID